MVMADGSTQQFSQSQLVTAMATSGDSRNCALNRIKFSDFSAR
jgi:hypothetical protein